MSRPITPTQLRRQLRRFGVPFVEDPGWTTRRRPSSTGSFDDVFGLVIHHTGDDAPDDLDLRVIRNGRSDLPGPLAQFGGRDDGKIVLVGNGRANHAGGGDPRVLAAVRRESYGAYPPKPTTHNGGAGAVDGNAHFYGLETFYSGAHPMTRKVRTSAVHLAAALCDFHGWSAKSVIGHKEWSDWKSDPGSEDMALFRADVQRVLDAIDDPDAPKVPVVEVAKASRKPGPTWTRIVPIRRALWRLRANTKSVARRRRILAAIRALDEDRKVPR